MTVFVLTYNYYELIMSCCLSIINGQLYGNSCSNYFFNRH